VNPDTLATLTALAPTIGAIAVACTMGWVATTWLRIKHGYPLEGAWGQSLKPATDHEAKQRITLLTQENAELRAELGAVKDRLANVERIVTDGGYHLGAEIDALRDTVHNRTLEQRKDEGRA
jgi:hypothetical protein